MTRIPIYFNIGFSIPLFALAIFFTQCLRINQGQENTDVAKDSTSLITDSLIEKEMPNQDSVLFSIITPDGKLVKEIKYAQDPFIDSNFYERPPYNNYIKGYPNYDTIKGDFNGDGIEEKAWFISNKTRSWDEGMTRLMHNKPIRSTLRFSDKRIGQLVIENCPTWIFKNEGDLDADGNDEIGILPGWFTSNCREYHIYSYKKNKWDLICSIPNTYNMREYGIQLIEKVESTPGYVIIRFPLLTFGDYFPVDKIPDKFFTYCCCSWSNVVEVKLRLDSLNRY